MSPIQSFTLRERAMLVSIHISNWMGQKLDRQTSEELNRDKNADSDASKVVKKLVSKETTAEVQTATSRARVVFRRLSMPWDVSVGIIPAARFEAFSKQIAECRAEFFIARDKFLVQYATARADAQRRMGKLFNADDYPDPATMRDRFAFEVVVMPVPDKGDFRVDLGDDVVASIKQGIEKRVNACVQAAQRNLWERLLKAMTYVAETLSVVDKTFQDRTLGKLITIADEVEALQLEPDDELSSMCKSFRKLAKSYDPDTLRDDVTTRSEAAKRAAATVKQIEKRMQGAF